MIYVVECETRNINSVADALRWNGYNELRIHRDNFTITLKADLAEKAKLEKIISEQDIPAFVRTKY